MSAKSWSGRTKNEVIIEVWEALDCESVGARELEQIQQAVREKFGDGMLESPASIARTVADEGAVLRHPEVFDCDTKWRERLISEAAPLNSLSFSNLADAVESIKMLESWRSKFAVQQGTRLELQRIREFALKTKQDLQLVWRSSVVEPKRQSEAGEIVQWLTIWLQDPAIFDDWLELRMRSSEFVERFCR
jgi:hypothetical protein